MEKNSNLPRLIRFVPQLNAPQKDIFPLVDGIIDPQRQAEAVMAGLHLGNEESSA